MWLSTHYFSGFLQDWFHVFLYEIKKKSVLYNFYQDTSPLEILHSQNVLRTSLLVSRTLPSNVPRTFWDGHDVEFFKGLGDVIWRTFPGHSGRSRDVYGTIFYLKIDVPKTSSERPCWCQGRCLVTSPERSETVTMSSSLKGWGTLFGGPSQDIQDVLGTFMGLYFIWKLTFPKRPQNVPAGVKDVA